MEKRIQELLQRLQDLSNDPSPKSIIDLDLMLDYTRVLYADLLTLRKNTPISSSVFKTTEATNEKEAVPKQQVSDETVAVFNQDSNPIPVEESTYQVPVQPEVVELVEENPVTSPVAPEVQEISTPQDSPLEIAISFEAPTNTVVPELEHLGHTLVEEIPAPPAPTPQIMHPENFSHSNRDIRKVIGINDKFLFLNELFNNHKTEYENTLDEINRLSNLDAALQWVQQKSATKTVWDEESSTVQNFIAVLKKHFSATI